jgi:hypothetical protein
MLKTLFLAALLLTADPGLDENLNIPRHWSVVREAGAVSATSPDADALIQISTSEAPGLDAAATAFFSAGGGKSERSWRSPIQGRAALWHRIRTRAGGGEVRGFAVFVADRGKIFQIVAVADAAVYRKYEEILRAAVESFGGAASVLGT